MFKILHRELARPISAAWYACIGFLLFVLKFAIDRALIGFTLQRKWTFLDYWRPHLWTPHSYAADWRFGLFLFICNAALFLCLGLLLTIRRIRTVGLSSWFAVLFVLPYVNLLFFVVLIALPEKLSRPARPQSIVVSVSRIGAIASATLIVVPTAVALIWLSTSVFGSYGGWLFLGVPFAMGFVTVMIYNWHFARGFAESIGVACLSVFCVGCSLLLLGTEGLVCLFMALLVALPFAFVGGATAYALVNMRQTRNTVAAALLVVPLLAPTEMKFHHGPEHFSVKSSIDIAAPPSVVWNHVVAFSEISEKPSSPILLTGIAYPIHATITGTGVGAVRQCVFTTGAFEEPIDVWDAPYLLRFSVAKQPPVMHEMSWVPDLQPPHVAQEYLRSRKGQFQLTALPNGHTLLEGTTWYDLEYWPSSYWHLWSDAIIHRIHMRVLEHIKMEVETLAVR